MLNSVKTAAQPNRQLLRSSTLIIVTFAIAFYPRILAAAGVPAVVNFLHFACIFLLLGFVLPRIRSRLHVKLSTQLLYGLYALFLAIATSAFWNDAGIINIILSFLLLSEPFIMLLAIVGIRMTPSSTQRFHGWLLAAGLINLLFAYIQYFVLKLQVVGGPDAIKGVFLNQGAGHHVGGAVALTSAVYVLNHPAFGALWLRAFLALSFLPQTFPMSDSKQVVAVFLGSMLLLTLTKIQKIGTAIKYLVISVLAIFGVYWAIVTLFPGLGYWLNFSLLVSSFQAKFSVFSIIHDAFTSPFNWLFGLGPGHTIGRLGWLIPDYAHILKPLGVTATQVTADIFTENDTNHLTNAITGSSMFSLTFSWAGIWGDLGLFGTGAYLYLWWVTWRHICVDNLSKFLVLNMLLFGAIFSWLEEPGYMLFVVSIIGLQWQSRQQKLAEQSAESYP
ncbi:MAG: hypothetical protein MUF49_02225 [Oculatellaceae cyanobacterium Prado106]|jgi:hypothetical protein|nr:hypothetical protein [Oculatellaceae cyanobacterium Prado106]